MTLHVDAIRTLGGVARHAAAIDALNLGSRRPCPYATFEYMRAFVTHDEYGTRDDEILFLAAFDEDRLIGYMPLRKRRVPLGPVSFGQIGWLLSHDTDRPHVVARAEDESRCADAFYRHLLDREGGWSFLELGMQDDASSLMKLPDVSELRYYARWFDSMPNTTVPLDTAASFGEWFKGLASSQRHNVARLSRRLFSSGRVEVMFCEDPKARRPLLDLYLDLERRSWKEAANAGVRRHPERVAFFQALAEPDQPLALGFDLVLLDDVPIAGLVSGAYAGGLYGLEMAFDAEYEDVAPGHLLSMMAIRRGMVGRYRSFNFDGNYAYYKARMGGVVTTTRAVQIYRVGGLPWCKARGGELLRKLRPPKEKDSQRYNPERRRVHEQESPPDPKDKSLKAPAPKPPRDAERELFLSTMKKLAAEGVRIDRMGGAAIEATLPFSTKREAA